MAEKKDYNWYGDWMDDHYKPWIDHQKKTSSAWDAYQKASNYALNYLGGKTEGTVAEFEEAQRRYAASDAAHSKYSALLDKEGSFDEGAKTAYEAWKTNPWDINEPMFEAPEEIASFDLAFNQDLGKEPELQGEQAKAGDIPTFFEEDKPEKNKDDDYDPAYDVIYEQITQEDLDKYPEMFRDGAQAGDMLDDSLSALGNSFRHDGSRPKTKEDLFKSFPESPVTKIKAEEKNPYWLDDALKKQLDHISSPQKDTFWDDDYGWQASDSILDKYRNAEEVTVIDPGDTNTDAAREQRKKQLEQEYGGIVRQRDTPSFEEGLNRDETIFIDPSHFQDPDIEKIPYTEDQQRIAELDQLIEDTKYTTGDKFKDFVGEFVKRSNNVKDILPNIAEETGIPGLDFGNTWDTLRAGASSLGKSLFHTKGWDNKYSDENPMEQWLPEDISNDRRDRANRFINSLSPDQIQHIQDTGRLPEGLLGKDKKDPGTLNEAMNRDEHGVNTKFSEFNPWRVTMNNLASDRMDIEPDPNNPGKYRVTRIYDNYQFDREGDVTFDIPGIRPVQALVEFMQNQNISDDDPLKTSYKMDESAPGTTRTTRRLPQQHTFKYPSKSSWNTSDAFKYTGKGVKKYNQGNVVGINPELLQQSTGSGTSAWDQQYKIFQNK